jgi:hypothetical protein
MPSRHFLRVPRLAIVGAEWNLMQSLIRAERGGHNGSLCVSNTKKGLPPWVVAYICHTGKTLRVSSCEKQGETPIRPHIYPMLRSVRVKLEPFRALDYQPSRRYMIGRAARVSSRRIRLAHRTFITASSLTPAPLQNSRQPVTGCTLTARSLVTMSSASTIYDFKPLDSTCALVPRLSHLHPGLFAHRANQFCLTTNRARQPRPPLGLQGQGRPDRQHRLQVRLHPAVRRPREAVQVAQGEARRRLCHPRLPLQPVRRPGARHQRRHRAVLPAQLRRQLPHHGQDRR